MAIDRLTKKYYYVVYSNIDKETTAKKMINILLKEIFRLYNLLTLIVSNRGS